MVVQPLLGLGGDPFLEELGECGADPAGIQPGSAAASRGSRWAASRFSPCRDPLVAAVTIPEPPGRDPGIKSLPPEQEKSLGMGAWGVPGAGRGCDGAGWGWSRGLGSGSFTEKFPDFIPVEHPGEPPSPWNAAGIPNPSLPSQKPVRAGPNPAGIEPKIPEPFPVGKTPRDGGKIGKSRAELPSSHKNSLSASKFPAGQIFRIRECRGTPRRGDPGMSIAPRIGIRCRNSQWDLGVPCSPLALPLINAFN